MKVEDWEQAEAVLAEIRTAAPHYIIGWCTEFPVEKMQRFAFYHTEISDAKLDAIAKHQHPHIRCTYMFDNMWFVFDTSEFALPFFDDIKTIRTALEKTKL